MARDIDRRTFVRAAGVAGVAGLAGCAGTGGSGGSAGSGGSGPEMLVVIGYPESGIQLFRDFYSMGDEETDVLVPDGLRDGAMPGQVGNEMSNVTGTAPAAGGPNQEAFTTLFEDEYDASPGVFTSQSYDSVALLLLANAAAGENTGTAIRDQLRRVANPDGTAYGPGELIEAVEAAAAGENVDFRGASSATNFNEAGDPASAAYAIWEFADESTTTLEVQNFEGESPEGAGPSADSAPGSSDRTLSVGILLPETGDLSSVGQPMVQAAQLPVMQINDTNPAGLSADAQIEDTQTSPNIGVTAAQSLASSGVPAVCGSASSGVNVPVSQEVFIPNEMVGCSPSSTALSVTNLDDDDYIFRTAPSDLLQGRVMAQVAAERLGNASAATLYVNNDYGQQLSERFTEVFEGEHGGTVTEQVGFNKGASSYTSALESALGS